MPADPARIRQSVEAYVAAWNETDSAARAALIERSCNPEVRLNTMNDPHVRGRAALDSYIVGFQHRRPGARVRITSVVEVRGSAYRVTGVVAGSGSVPDIAATDMGECDDDGRILLVLTFPGLVPEQL